MLRVKTTEIFAIAILTIFVWLVGWIWNDLIRMPKVLNDFIVGFGLLSTMAYLWTVFKELGE